MEQPHKIDLVQICRSYDFVGSLLRLLKATHVFTDQLKCVVSQAVWVRLKDRKTGKEREKQTEYVKEIHRIPIQNEKIQIIQY